MAFLSTHSQLKTLSEILSDIAQVSLAGTVVPPLVAGFDSEKIPVVISGLVISLCSWFLSLSVVKKVKL